MIFLKNAGGHSINSQDSCGVRNKEKCEHYDMSKRPHLRIGD